MGAVEHWAAEAARWAAWVRTPRHDAITFKGWCYPFSTYTRALEAGAFVVEALREPEPSPDAPPRMDRYRRIPNFLMFRALNARARPAGRRRQTPTSARAPRARRTG